MNLIKFSLRTLPLIALFSLSTPSYAASFDDSLAADFEVRISTLQEEMQRLRGAVEEKDHAISVLQQQVQKLNSDVDFRLNQLENKSYSQANQQAQTTQSQNLQSQSPQSQPPASEPSLTSQNNQPTQNLTREETHQFPQEQVAQAKSSSTEPAASSTNSPKDDYDRAFGLLRDMDYEGAEKGFSGFIARYPSDNLVPNAQYWLSETFYVRGEFKDAAIQFAEGYQKFPTHSKAMDNLFKLGLSLSALNKKEDACTTFGQFLIKYKKAPISVTKRVQSERSKLNCK